MHNESIPNSEVVFSIFIDYAMIGDAMMVELRWSEEWQEWLILIMLNDSGSATWGEKKKCWLKFIVKEEEIRYSLEFRILREFKCLMFDWHSVEYWELLMTM